LDARLFLKGIIHDTKEYTPTEYYLMTILHQTSGRWRLGLGLSLLTLFLWGILPIALKVTLQSLDIYTITWFRFLVSCSLLALYLGIQGKLPKFSLIRSNYKLLAIATIFLAGNYIFFLRGLALTTAANAQVLIQLSMLLMSLGGLVIFKEKYNRPQWIGVGVIILGFILFFQGKLNSLASSKDTYILGSFLIIIGATAWSIYGLAQKQLLQSLSSVHVMLILYGGCALLFTPFAQPQTILTLDSLHLGALIFCALNTLIAYGSFAEALEHWEASTVSAVLASTPIVTLISTTLVSGIAPLIIPPESLTFIAIMGALLVVLGSVFVALGKRTNQISSS
jgi:drug/metabolite transporter (DMT)-like permease